MQLELKANVNKLYKIKAIWNNIIYIKKSESNHLPRLYYLIFLFYLFYIIKFFNYIKNHSFS